MEDNYVYTLVGYMLISKTSILRASNVAKICVMFTPRWEPQNMLNLIRHERVTQIQPPFQVNPYRPETNRLCCDIQIENKTGYSLQYMQPHLIHVENDFQGPTLIMTTAEHCNEKSLSPQKIVPFRETIT